MNLIVKSIYDNSCISLLKLKGTVTVSVTVPLV